MSAIIHIAGQYREMVQDCSRCGENLIDYRNAAWDSADGPPRAWEEGAEVVMQKAPGAGFASLRSYFSGVAALCRAE